MTHLNESQRNEYLDGELSLTERQAVELHLAACANCRAALADLQAVFWTLDELYDVALTADLSSRIVAQLKAEAEASSWLRPLLLAQIIVFTGMAARLWPVIQDWLMAAETAVRAALISFTLPQLWPWERLLTWGTAAWRQLQLARPAINLVAWQWAVLLILALAVWLAGNWLLFDNEQ